MADFVISQIRSFSLAISSIFCWIHSTITEMSQSEASVCVCVCGREGGGGGGGGGGGRTK